MKSLKWFVYFLILIVLGNFVLTGKEKVLPKPPPIKPPLPKKVPLSKWSDFKYNSDEEKAFWENLPDWTAILTPNANPQKSYPAKRNSMGDKIEENATGGFDGYVKSLFSRFSGFEVGRTYMGRVVYEFMDGYVVRYKFIDLEGKVIAKQNFKYGIPHGLMTEWHKNGQKSSEGEFKDGKKDGSWTTWSQNGQKSSEGIYKSGKKHGLWVEDSPPFKFTKINYKEGMKDGLWTQRLFQVREEGNYKANSKEGVWTTWSHNGQKTREENYKAGKREGLWTRWSANGPMQYQWNYKDGKKEGLESFWYENGQKCYETNYKDGKKDGLSTRWYKNGHKSSVRFYEAGNRADRYGSFQPKLVTADAWTSDGEKCVITNVRAGSGEFVSYWLNNEKNFHKTYHNGYLHGKSTWWYENGQKKSEENYKDGKQEGLSTEWYENGQKKSEVNYKDGKVSGNTRYWTEDGKPKPNRAIRVPPNILPPEHPSPFIRPGSRIESRPANSLAPKKVHIIKTKKPEWSDFKYNSEEEKSFWDKLPDFPIFDHFGARRVNLKGLSVDQNSTENGYTGYQKKISSFYQGQRFERILSKYQDGFLVKRASWYENGKKKSEETYKDGKRIGVWNEWYENGKIKSEGNYNDGIAIWTDWHKNGQKSKESNYKDELEDGLWTWWHDNGQKSSEGKYSKGEKEGLWTSWDANGFKSSEGKYSKGEKEGLWVSWYWNSEKISSKGIYSDGEKKGFWTERGLEGNYTDGKRHGLWNEWYENGQIKSEKTYKDGKEFGVWTQWFESGKKQVEKKFKEDSESGLHECIFWHENGQKKSEGLSIRLSRTGLWTEWYENGQKKSEINYKNGKVSGNTRYWTADGRPTDKPEIRMPPRSKISIPKRQQEQD